MKDKGRRLALVLSVILIVAVGLAISELLHKNSNSDGTSKAAVYTKIADFGSYSQWAQQQLNSGFNMCQIQNILAKSDNNVSFVRDCAGSASTNCTTVNVGDTANSDCETTLRTN